MSDVASLQSNPPGGGSRWWTFTLPRTRPEAFGRPHNPPKPERKTFRDLSLPWMPISTSQREGTSFLRKEKEKESEELANHLSIPMSARLPVQYTVAHTNTPGWDTPWTSRPNAQGPSRHDRLESYGFEEDNSSESGRDNLSRWGRRRKQIRSFILVNTYVPLVCNTSLLRLEPYSNYGSALSIH